MKVVMAICLFCVVISCLCSSMYIQMSENATDMVFHDQISLNQVLC